MDPTWLWALPWAAVVAVLLARRRRLGELRVATWLIAIGAFLMSGEDGALSAWYALAPPSVDPDGAAGLVHPHAAAHMLGAGIWTFVAAALVIVIARVPLARGERWAWWAVAAAFVAGVGADLVSYGALYTHGLDLPLPGNHGGFGWPPVAIALIAWIAGLALAWRGLPPRPAP